MMFLISAVPGSGKTLRIVGKILKMQSENDKAEAEGKPRRRIYSNVKGLVIPGVEPAPDDWRDTPQNSIVIYDEAQEIFPATGSSGISKDERVTAMTTHRHTGHDLYFLTQDPIFLDATLRKLVGTHEHLWRASSLQAATVYTWDGHQSSPMSSTALKTADESTWAFPKAHYAFYKSASHHTHKFVMPKKILFLGIALLAVVVGFAWLMFGRADSFSVLRKALPGHAASVSEEGAAAPGAVAAKGSAKRPDSWQAAESLPALSGCAMLSNSCRAWNAEGQQLDISRAECLNLCLGPMPLDFSDYKKNKDAIASSPAVAAPASQEFDGAMFFPPAGVPSVSPSPAQGRQPIGVTRFQP